MANKVLDLFQASTAFTITLDSLASSGTGGGRQSTLIDNSSAREIEARIFVKLTQGTSPTANRGAYIYLITGDNIASGTKHRTDGAGATDAAITIQNAPLIGTMRNKASPATGDILYGEFLVRIAAPEWGIVVAHDTGVALNTTAGNHWARYVLISPEIQ